MKYTATHLHDYEKVLINDVFNRCYGLKEALQRTEDKLLQRGATESLAHQSGLRKEFIEAHLSEILLL